MKYLRQLRCKCHSAHKLPEVAHPKNRKACLISNFRNVSLHTNPLQSFSVKYNKNETCGNLLLNKNLKGKACRSYDGEVIPFLKLPPPPPQIHAWRQRQKFRYKNVRGLTPIIRGWPRTFLMSKFMVHNMDLYILPIVRANRQPIWYLPCNFYEWLNQIFAQTRVNICTHQTLSYIIADIMLHLKIFVLWNAVHLLCKGTYR